MGGFQVSFPGLILWNWAWPHQIDGFNQNIEVWKRRRMVSNTPNETGGLQQKWIYVCLCNQFMWKCAQTNINSEAYGRKGLTGQDFPCSEDASETTKTFLSGAGTWDSGTSGSSFSWSIQGKRHLGNAKRLAHLLYFFAAWDVTLQQRSQLRLDLRMLSHHFHLFSPDSESRFPKFAPIL